MAYPSITPLNGVKETTIGKTVKSSFDSNYVQQRPKTTRFRKSFEMDYYLTAAQFETFDTFYKENLGLSFAFNHPITSTVYTVRFSEDQLECMWAYSDLVKITVTLEEV